MISSKEAQAWKTTCVIQMKKWDEASTLELITAVQGAEDAWGGGDWEDYQETKWKHIANELPHLRAYLKLDMQQFPDICKNRFARICRYFNDVFTIQIRRNCLTCKLMTALASYSLRSDHHYFFPKIGLREHFRPIIVVDERDQSDTGSNASTLNCVSPASSDEHGSKVEKQATEGSTADTTKDGSVKVQTRALRTLACRTDVPRIKRLVQRRAEQDVVVNATPSIFEGKKAPPFIVKVTDAHVTKLTLVSIDRDFGLTFLPRGEPVFFTCIVNEELYKLKYLPKVCSFSAGWSKFVRANRVKANDELSFRCLDRLTYQVKIMRKGL